MKYEPRPAPLEAKSVGSGSEEVVRAMAAAGGPGRVQPRRSDLQPSQGPRVGVDQKSHDQWVMSMSVAVSYDERGEARDAACHCGARDRPGIEGGRCVLVDRRYRGRGVRNREVR